MVNISSIEIDPIEARLLPDEYKTNFMPIRVISLQNGHSPKTMVSIVPIWINQTTGRAEKAISFDLITSSLSSPSVKSAARIQVEQGTSVLSTGTWRKLGN